MENEPEKGISAFSGRKGKMEKDQSQRTISREDIGYAIYSVKPGACEECRKLDGLYILLTHEAYGQTINTPNPKCTHARGCACVWIYVFKAEMGSNEIVKILERCGGIATKKEFSIYYEKAKQERYIEKTRQWAAKQVNDALLRADLLKTPKGKINRLRKSYEYLLQAYRETLNDEHVQGQIYRIENRIRELEADSGGLKQ